MARCSLSPEERAAWGRVAATVRPIAGRSALIPTVSLVPHGAAPRAQTIMAQAADERPKPKPKSAPGQTLDASWDKRLVTGKASPDRTIDLHGHNLASAHALLDKALGDAIRAGARLVLLITGRPARDNPRMPPTGRGVIRASVTDWLLAGPHAGRIAAIRNAHPRHGGAGALYLIIRRDRG